MKYDINRKIASLFALLFGALFIGTISYVYVEEMSLFDALYMTIITMSTVGFEELFPLSRNGRIVTIGVIFSGITVVAYAAGSLIKLIVEGEIKESLGRRKLDRLIQKLKNHYIICGYGRIGSLVASELQKDGYDCIIIEKNHSAIERLNTDNMIYIIEDATNEEVLEKAGITKAKGIVTAVKTDADNVFIVLTARSMNPNTYILSRASELSTESKLKRAGATKVILPYIIGGKRMAQALIRPAVVDFIDMTMLDTAFGLEMGEVTITPYSNYIGKTLIESNIRNDFGIIIIAIKKVNGTMTFNPTSTAMLEESDALVFVGKKIHMEKIRERF